MSNAWNGNQPGERPDIPSLAQGDVITHMEDRAGPGDIIADATDIGYASSVVRLPPKFPSASDWFWVRARAALGMPVTVRLVSGMMSPTGDPYPPSMAVSCGNGRHWLVPLELISGYEWRMDTDRAFGYCSHRSAINRPFQAPTTQATPQDIPISGGSLQTGTLSISSGGAGYSQSGFDRPLATIIGDGTGGSVGSITIDASGTITAVNIAGGGSGYTWAQVRFYLPARARTGWAWGVPQGPGGDDYGFEAYYRLPIGGELLTHPMPLPASEWGPINPGLEMGDWQLTGAPQGAGLRYENFRHGPVDGGTVERLAHCAESWGISRYWADFDTNFFTVTGDWGLSADVSYDRRAGVGLQRWRWLGVIPEPGTGYGTVAATAWRYNINFRDGAGQGITARWEPTIDGGEVVGFNPETIRMGIGYAGTEGFSIDVEPPGATPPTLALEFTDDDQGYGRVSGVNIISAGSGITNITLTIDPPTQPVPDTVYIRAHPVALDYIAGGTTGSITAEWYVDSVSTDGGIDDDDGSQNYTTTSGDWESIGTYVISDDTLNSVPVAEDVTALKALENQAIEATSNTAWDWIEIGPPFNDDGTDDGSRITLDFEGRFGSIAWAYMPWRSLPSVDSSWHLAAIEVGLSGGDPSLLIAEWYGQNWIEVYNHPLPLPFSVGGPAGVAFGQVPE